MAEKICLICTLGNRDIQFKNEYEDTLEKKLKGSFNTNRDDSNYLVINPDIFKPTAQKILENYGEFKDYVEIPMINKVISEKCNGDIDKIYLIATNQKDADEKYTIKDTIYEAEIIKKMLSNNYDVEVTPAEFNAKNMEEWFKLIKGLFDNILKDNKKIVIEFSGGVNETKEAIRLASLFNEDITVYEIINDEPKDMNSHFYEKSIVKEKVKDLIKHYNYRGALSFEKYLSKDVKNALEYSNYRLNFDFDNANKIAKKNALIKELNERLEKIKTEKDTIKKLEYLIFELLDNMDIELKNGNYANFLARVYRLEEAMGQYFVLKWLSDNECCIHYIYGKESKEYNKKPQYLPISQNRYNRGINRYLADYFNYVLNASSKNGNKYKNCNIPKNKYANCMNQNEKELVNNLCELVLCKSVQNRMSIGPELNTINYSRIVNKLYNSKEITVFNNISKIYRYYNNKTRENISLRNSTIVAHGFEGISEYKINYVLSKHEIDKPISEFFKDDIRGKFYNIVNKNNKNENKNIFDEIKEAIISNL